MEQFAIPRAKHRSNPTHDFHQIPKYIFEFSQKLIIGRRIFLFITIIIKDHETKKQKNKNKTLQLRTRLTSIKLELLLKLAVSSGRLRPTYKSN